jgi:hypothetical protein
MFLFTPPAARSAEPEVSPAKALHESLTLPGVSLSEGVSEITGVAISPLLGVSALGAWKYWQTEAALRPRLPWYCHPYVWGTGLALLGICFLKDLLGTATPALVKKPLDFIELFEDKASALVASTAFVPLVALAIAQYERMQPPEQALSALSSSGLATMPVASLADYTMHNPWVTVPVAVVAFLIVWLSAHAINVLIAMSPFKLVDSGLKLFKLALIAVVAGSAAINPYLGALVSLVLMLIAAVIAGWSFRLTVFGTLMGWDVLTNRRASGDEVRERGARAFLARRTGGVPVRTMGRVHVTEEGQLCFAYRPWLVLPERRIPLQCAETTVCRGLLYSSLCVRVADDLRLSRIAILRPRYRGVEEAMAARFGCGGVVDSPLMRGVKAVRAWFRMEATAVRPRLGAGDA